MEPPSGQRKGELSLQGSKPGRVKVQELGFVSSNFKAEIAGKVANGSFLLPTQSADSARE